MATRWAGTPGRSRRRLSCSRTHTSPGTLCHRERTRSRQLFSAPIQSLFPDRWQGVGSGCWRRTGDQWRGLPERLGPWKTVCERHRLWSAGGTRERLLQQVEAEAEAEVAGEIDWDVSVDSTVVRAHQHAAGARNEPPRLKEGHRGRTPGRDGVAEPPRPPGGGGAGGEGLEPLAARVHHQAAASGQQDGPGLLDAAEEVTGEVMAVPAVVLLEGGNSATSLIDLTHQSVDPSTIVASATR
ncbi:transposase [Streptomyces rutgersensis]|uniref:Transposase n=1 Tax=Streptomyces rutgersensis TaxID=53451 RepID=A0ABX6RVP7_9ACTN|nr:transposase [Streptomyces rutgersensis]